MVDLINDFDHRRVWIAEEGAVRLLLGLGLGCEEKISEEGWAGLDMKENIGISFIQTGKRIHNGN